MTTLTSDVPRAHLMAWRWQLARVDDELKVATDDLVRVNLMAERDDIQRHIAKCVRIVRSLGYDPDDAY